MTLNELFSNVTEGLYDPHIFKALIVIGGPGSGKSVISRALVAGSGLRTVNVDDFYEMIKKRQGMGDFEVPKVDPDFVKSRESRKLRRNLLLDGRVGILLDVTGRWKPSVLKEIESLKKFGYDVAVLSVKTGVKTAIKRQSMRARKIDPQTVIEFHSQVQQNIPTYRERLGKNFVTIDNTGTKSVDQLLSEPTQLNDMIAAPLGLRRWFARWVNAPVTNSIATQWIDQQRRVQGITAPVDESMHNVAEADKRLPATKKQIIVKGNSKIQLLTAQIRKYKNELKQHEETVKYYQRELAEYPHLNKDLVKAYTAHVKYSKNKQEKLPKLIELKQAELQQIIDQSNITANLPLLIDRLEKEAGRYWNVYKEIGRVLWRGRKLTAQYAVFQSTSRTGRTPADSDTGATRLYDQALDQLGIKAKRSNSIYTSNALYRAHAYASTAYVIIPKNTANFSWSRVETDLVLDVGEVPVKQGQIDLRRFQDRFDVRADNFADAVNSGNEVLISGEYFAIRADIWKLMLDLGLLPDSLHRSVY
jgi:dephospho-CoA kinase